MDLEKETNSGWRMLVTAGLVAATMAAQGCNSIRAAYRPETYILGPDYTIEKMRQERLEEKREKKERKSKPSPGYTYILQTQYGSFPVVVPPSQ